MSDLDIIVDASRVDPLAIISRTDVALARRLTGLLRESREQSWTCLRRRLTEDHGLDAQYSVLLDMWPDQAGESGWLISSDYRLIDFDFEVGPAPAVDQDPCRFVGWSEEPFEKDLDAVRAADALVHALTE